MKNFKVEGEHEISVKRFYFPVKVEIQCPHCGEKNEEDFNNNYLSYPVINKEERCYMTCDDCEKEFEFDIVLRVSLDADTKSRKL